MSIDEAINAYHAGVAAYNAEIATGRQARGYTELIEMPVLEIGWALLHAIGEEREPDKGESPRATLPPRKAVISDRIRWDVWERDDFTCQSCGVRRDLSVDHILAESKGGALDPDNLQTLCRPCNSRKGAR